MSSTICKHNCLAFALIYNLIYYGALRGPNMQHKFSRKRTSALLNNVESYSKLKKKINKKKIKKKFKK